MVKYQIYKSDLYRTLFQLFFKNGLHGQTRQGQPGEGRASRELCTFYTFVLCTALLILHPIMLLLEPICKELLQKFIFVSVDNTSQQERKKCIVAHTVFFFPAEFWVSFVSVFLVILKSPSHFFSLLVLISIGYMGALILQQRSEGYRSILSIRYTALPYKLGVSLQR